MGFKKLRFRTKLYLGFIIVVLFATIIGFVGLKNLNIVHYNIELIYKHPLTVSNAVRDVNTNIYAIHRSMKDVVLSESKAELDSAISLVSVYNSSVLEAFNIIFENFLGNMSDVDIAYDAFVKWEQIRNEVIILKKEGNDVDAARITKGKGDDYVKMLFLKTQKMSDFAQNKADEFKTHSENTYNKTIRTITVLILVLLGLSVLIIFIVSKSILRPIKEFISKVRSLYQNGESISNEVRYASESDLLLITISELKNAYTQINEANHEYQTLNEELDEKVKERTLELEGNQFNLKEKNEEYLAINEEYEMLNEELKQSNQELIDSKKKTEDSETRFRALHNASFGGIAIHDKGVVLDCNQGLSDISGYSYEELIGMDGLLLIAEGSREMVMQNILAQFEESYEAIGVRKNGEEYPLRLEGKMIPYMEKEARVVEFRDITEQKTMENKLRQTLVREQIQADIVRTTPVAIAFGYPDGRLDNCNKSFSELTGYSEKELKSINWNEVLTPVKWNEIEAEELKKLSPKNNYIQYEKEYFHKNGNVIPIELVVTATFNKDDQLVHFVGFVSDITERKQSEIRLANQNEEYQSINEELLQTIEELNLAKEKAVESDNLKSAFLANMSHEIRTPMNGIVGFAKLLQKHDLSKGKLEDYIKIIVNSSNQLLSIVNDILDISRIETGQIDLYEGKINLNETLEEIKSFFELKTDEKGLKLNLISELENKNSDIIIDDSKLKQILFNLIGNALKFTHEGSIDFGYNLDGDKINFFVKDTGIGISTKDQKNIFSRFIKVEQTSDQLYGGTGLGLAICKGLAERMGGNIWVESKPKEGSSFFISLPYKKNKSSKEEYKIKKEDINFLKFNIIIVEDEEVNAFYLKELLKKENINFTHVWNGEDAVKLCLNNDDVDLVLMDIKLPKMSGLEATKKIKEKKPNLPIIAQTAYAMKSDEIEALRVGCDAYISKPIIEEKLMGILSKYFNNKS
jgi:PAS domain S-box-containing protein